MPRLVIDGREVEVTPGSNLLAAARKLGVDIPALCYFPGLPAGTSCMACIVKVRNGNGPTSNGAAASNSDRIVPACATAAADGMIIESETPEIHGLRRTALELLLSDHVGTWESENAGLEEHGTQDERSVGTVHTLSPSHLPTSDACVRDDVAAFDCTCPKASICRLRRYARRYGCDPSRYRGERRIIARTFAHPEITFDPGKCILCGICVQLARQAGEQLGLTLVGRGFNVRLDVPLGGELSDALRVAARRCAGACPTSALAPKSEDTAHPRHAPLSITPLPKLPAGK